MPGLLGSGIAVRVHTPIRFADGLWDDDSFLSGRQSNTGLGPGGGAIVPANLHRVQPARIMPSEWTVPIPTPPQRRNKIEEALAASRMRDAKSRANKAGEKKNKPRPQSTTSYRSCESQGETSQVLRRCFFV